MKNKITVLKYRFGKIFRNHQAFVVAVGVLLVATVVIVRISTLNSLPSDQAYVEEQKSKLTLVRFNKEAIEQMQSLQESNVVTPGTQLPQNRQNPFSE